MISVYEDWELPAIQEYLFLGTRLALIIVTSLFGDKLGAST